jgi:hypothetical protein
LSQSLWNSTRKNGRNEGLYVPLFAANPLSFEATARAVVPLYVRLQIGWNVGTVALS